MKNPILPILLTIFLFGVGASAQSTYWVPGSGGTVTSVAGTTNQIDVATGTTTAIISLDPALNLGGTFTAHQFYGNNRNYRYYQFLCHSRSGPRIVYRQPEWRGIPI
jgi:hypothetical protein